MGRCCWSRQDRRSGPASVGSAKIPMYCANSSTDLVAAMELNESGKGLILAYRESTNLHSISPGMLLSKLISHLIDRTDGLHEHVM